MGSVGESAGMQGHHSGMNIVAREEFSLVVENQFVVVIIVVKERYFQRIRIRFEGSGDEGANNKPTRKKRRVCRRRQVVAMAHQRAYVAPVYAHRCKVALPAHRIQGVERIADLA